MNNIWNELSEESKKNIITTYNNLQINTEYPESYIVLEKLFGEENLNPNPPIKTWEDLEKYNKARADLYAPVFSELSACNLLPRALFRKLIATIQIAELIEQGYGGMVTTTEWRDYASVKYCISAISKRLGKTEVYDTYEFIAFHTKAQRDEFYNNNEQLCKDYYMI